MEGWGAHGIDSDEVESRLSGEKGSKFSIEDGGMGISGMLNFNNAW